MAGVVALLLLGRRARRGLLPGLALLVGATSLVHAQQRLAVITGHVLDSVAGLPIAGAEVSLVGRTGFAISNEAGHFELTSVASGLQVIQLRALGYRRVLARLTVPEGDTMPVTFLATRSENRLATVTVEDTSIRRGTRFEDFDRRRAQGRGYFVSRVEIEKRNARSLVELLQGAKGVRIDCAGFNCSVRMARSAAGCMPQIFVDGRLSSTFGPNTPLRDVEGVEMYLGPSETPAEYLGNDSSCGVIALWTKSGP